MGTYKLKDGDERHITVDGSRLDKMLAADDRYESVGDEPAPVAAEPATDAAVEPTATDDKPKRKGKAGS